MKYCPTCETRYDEEILRFCMKDGTPLLDVDEPNFINAPSEALEPPERIEEDEDDPGELTVVRRNLPVPPPPPEDFAEEASIEQPPPPPPRIVVPTTPVIDPRPATREYREPAPRTNTLAVVALTIFATLAILAIGAGGFWLLQRGGSSNTNQNANANLGNVNTDLNTNLNIDSNFNFNSVPSFNTNTNTNANTNTRTPTPTPKPSPSATPSPTPDEDATPTPTRSPIPTPTPIIIRPGQPTPDRDGSPSGSPPNGAVLNSRAVNLPTPSYPSNARQLGVGGRVSVQVSVDERGNVTSARAVSGPVLLRSAAEAAARRSKLRPDRSPVVGYLVYDFKNN